MDQEPGNQLDLKVGFELPPDQWSEAAEILYEAFEQKFRPMFGSRELAVGYLSKSFRAERIVTATLNGSLVGIGALIYGKVEPINYGLHRLIRHLGPGTLRFLLVGMVFMLAGKPEDELYVDMLAVDGRFRGRGIGGKMLDFIIDFAMTRGFRGVSLHVIDTNDRARAFYEERGFEERGHVRIIPWDRVLGFKGAFEMVYRI